MEGVSRDHALAETQRTSSLQRPHASTWASLRRRFCLWPTSCCGEWSRRHDLALRHFVRVLAVAFVRPCQCGLPSGIARFLGRPLVRCSSLMHRSTAPACNFELPFLRHRRKAAVVDGHAPSSGAELQDDNRAAKAARGAQRRCSDELLYLNTLCPSSIRWGINYSARRRRLQRHVEAVEPRRALFGRCLSLGTHARLSFSQRQGAFHG